MTTPMGVEARPDLSLDELSSLFCGNRLRLGLSTWIRGLPEGCTFYMGEVAREIGSAPTQMRSEFDRLEQLGAIQQLPKADGDVRCLYLADREHPFWPIIDAAAACASELSGGGSVESLFAE